MKAENIKSTKNSGCDFIVSLNGKRKNDTIRFLQLTDTQFIDASQRRTFDRIRIDEINAWKRENFDLQCKNHIKSLVAQANPDFIFITGDVVYGSFDDDGSMLVDFCEFMDTFEIPWSPVFGNHDNESAKGVAWQCEQLEKSKYCVFKRGNVSGNCNYTVGISVGGELVRVMHFIDSNGCADCTDEAVIKTPGIFPDQAELILEKSKKIEEKNGRKIPAFVAFHIPVKEFEDAEIHKEYKTNEKEMYTIGVDVEAKDGDFGFKLEKYTSVKTEFDFLGLMKKCNVDGVFTGHCHNISTVIEYEKIKWVFGLKTGQYDYHIPGQLGGTLINILNDDFTVTHIPSLVHYAPYPGKANMFESFFAEEEYIES